MTVYSEYRRGRLLALRDVFLKTEKGNTVSLTHQKHYICVYFCCADLVDPIRENHLKLSIGTGCVRIRDSQSVPTDDLKKAFKNALHMKKNSYSVPGQ